jgi:hypothetical protein
MSSPCVLLYLFVRLSSRLTWALMVLNADKAVNSNVETTTRSLFVATFSGKKSYVLLSAFVVHMVQYIIHRYHIISTLMDTDHTLQCVINTKFYTLAHLSVLNFVLDLPAWNIPSVNMSKKIIILVNLVSRLSHSCL